MWNRFEALSAREKSFIEACPYCPGTPVLALRGHELYPYRDDYGAVWICPDCRAYVGCHRGTNRPKGRLGDRALHDLRKLAHSLFDPIWKTGEMKRKQAYLRMAEVIGIPPEEAHISQLNTEQLNKLIRSLKARKRHGKSNGTNRKIQTDDQDTS